MQPGILPSLLLTQRQAQRTGCLPLPHSEGQLSPASPLAALPLPRTPRPALRLCLCRERAASTAAPPCCSCPCPSCPCSCPSCPCSCPKAPRTAFQTKWTVEAHPLPSKCNIAALGCTTERTFCLEPKPHGVQSAYWAIMTIHIMT